MTNTERKNPTPAIATEVSGTALTITFSNGETISFRAEDMTADIREAAMMHGFKQKLVDAAAISRDPETGRAATIETKADAVREVFERLRAGQWNKVREGGAGSGGLLFKALCRVYASKTPADIRAILDDMTPAEQTALRRAPKVAAAIDAIRAESGSSVDSEDLMARFEE